MTRACRLCGRELTETFVDLGPSPLCETYAHPDHLSTPDPLYPLHAWICSGCLLVQLEEVVSPDAIFSEYAYFSSYSDSWVEHARRYCESTPALVGLQPGSHIVEIASNDGYLLQHFIGRGYRVLGVEPAANVAAVARQKGVETECLFFGTETAARIVESHGQADLLIGNNVLAHVADLHDFVGGLKRLLASSGTLTMEFPHLVALVEGGQFDTIYHEHFSYFSLYTAEQVFAAHGLTVVDVDELPSHGGSLRVFVRHADTAPIASERLIAVRTREQRGGYDTMAAYRHFGAQAQRARDTLLTFLTDARTQGLHVAGYGAPGKGNTLLNYCGIGPELLSYTVDRNPYKQGLFTPGTRVPILHPDRIAETRPDVILILPWNLAREIAAQLSYTRAWGARLVVPIPTVRDVS
ncbi:MAG: class I SAM-dependent methyltransferase [Vicinamibacterales bacterium]